MKLTFSVRKKGIKDFPLMERLETLFPPSDTKIKLDPWTIITACNHRLFMGFQLLCYSLIQLHEAEIFCYDVGMTDVQLKWCSKIPGLHIEKHVEKRWDNVDYWQAWVKPFYIRNCPFQKCFWIDADTAIFRDINEIVKCAGNQALFIPDYTPSAPLTLNSDFLYKQLPISGIDKDEPPYLNTGVFLIDKERDSGIIDQWCYCTEQALNDKDIAYHIACWDQGACRWALQREGLLKKLVVPIKEYNFPDYFRQYAYPPRPSALDHFFNTAESAKADNALILHWCGSPKPWARWGSLFDFEPVHVSQQTEVPPDHHAELTRILSREET